MRLTLYLVLAVLISAPGCGKKNIAKFAKKGGLFGKKEVVLDPNAEPRGDQHGERIIPTNANAKAIEDSPLRRHSRTPWYQLSNLRKDESKFGFAGEVVILFDFERTGSEENLENVKLMVRSKEGRGPASGFWGRDAFSKDSKGTIRLDIKDFRFPGMDQIMQQAKGGKTEPDLELWMEQTLTGVGGTKVFKVSNSIVFGNPRFNTFSREWNDAEEKELTNWVRTGSVMPAMPADYVKYDGSVKLIPGTPLLISGSGDWTPAEFVGAGDADQLGAGSHLVKYEKSDKLDSVRDSEILIAETTLSDIKTNPAKFTPSVRVLPGGRIVIPDDSVPVDAATPLKVGVNLKCDFRDNGAWYDVVVVEPQTASGKVLVKSANHSDEKELKRNEFIISKAMLAQIQDPNFVADPPKERPIDVVKKRMDAGRAKIKMREKPDDKAPEIGAANVEPPRGVDRNEVPAGFDPVPDGTKLVKGTPVKFKSSFGWEDGLVLRVLKDGQFLVGKPDGSKHWDKTLSADQFLISKETVEELKIPETAEKYSLQARMRMSSRMDHYPIKSAIPSKAVQVTRKTPIEVGTPLGYNDFFGKWSDVTVVELVDEDVVKVMEPGRFNKEMEMDRECLIIEKAVLGRLERDKKKKEKEKAEAAAAEAEKAKKAEFHLPAK